MGDIGDEIAADGLKASDAREVLHEEQAAAAVMVGDRDQLDKLAARWKLERFGLHLAGLLATPPGIDELMMAQDLGHCLAGRRRSGEESPRGRVRELDL